MSTGLSEMGEPQPQPGMTGTGTGTPDPAAGGPTPPRADQNFGRQLRERLLGGSSALWIFLALVLIIVVFSIMKPSAFLGSFNIKTIFINASVALCLSVGMTFVIITAGIDLSVGATLGFSGMLGSQLMQSTCHRDRFDSIAPRARRRDRSSRRGRLRSAPGRGAPG